MGGGDPFSSFFGGDFGGIVTKKHPFLVMFIHLFLIFFHSYHRTDLRNVYF